MQDRELYRQISGIESPWKVERVRRIRLTPMLAVARILAARLDNILTYLKHRITNAVSESLNSRIQWVKATARGFRNQQNFINAIYLHCGGLDMAPGH